MKRLRRGFAVALTLMLLLTMCSTMEVAAQSNVAMRSTALNLPAIEQGRFLESIEAYTKLAPTSTGVTWYLGAQSAINEARSSNYGMWRGDSLNAVFDAALPEGMNQSSTKLRYVYQSNDTAPAPGANVWKDAEGFTCPYTGAVVADSVWLIVEAQPIVEEEGGEGGPSETKAAEAQYCAFHIVPLSLSAVNIILPNESAADPVESFAFGYADGDPSDTATKATITVAAQPVFATGNGAQKYVVTGVGGLNAETASDKTLGGRKYSYSWTTDGVPSGSSCTQSISTVDLGLTNYKCTFMVDAALSEAPQTADRALALTITAPQLDAPQPQTITQAESDRSLELAWTKETKPGTKPDFSAWQVNVEPAGPNATASPRPTVEAAKPNEKGVELTIDGNSAAPGQYTYTVQVRDGEGENVGRSVTGTITVADAVPVKFSEPTATANYVAGQSVNLEATTTATAPAAWKWEHSASVVGALGTQSPATPSMSSTCTYTQDVPGTVAAGSITATATLPNGGSGGVTPEPSARAGALLSGSASNPAPINFYELAEQQANIQALWKDGTATITLPTAANLLWTLDGYTPVRAPGTWNNGTAVIDSITVTPPEGETNNKVDVPARPEQAATYTAQKTGTYTFQITLKSGKTIDAREGFPGAQPDALTTTVTATVSKADMAIEAEADGGSTKYVGQGLTKPLTLTVNTTYPTVEAQLGGSKLSFTWTVNGFAPAPAWMDQKDSTFSSSLTLKGPEYLSKQTGTIEAECTVSAVNDPAFKKAVVPFTVNIVAPPTIDVAPGQVVPYEELVTFTPAYSGSNQPEFSADAYAWQYCIVAGSSQLPASPDWKKVESGQGGFYVGTESQKNLLKKGQNK